MEPGGLNRPASSILETASAADRSAADVFLG
jgi:hypothetical protein